MARDRLREAHLLGLPEGAQAERGGEREPPVIEAEADLGGEPAGEGEAPLNPELLLAEGLGDRTDGEAVFIRQRRRHARLVHRAGGLLGGVGLQEPRLGSGAGDGLDHDGDLAPPLASPEGQAFESVQEFVDAVADREHAQGQESKRGFAVRPLAAQGGERGPEVLDGHVQDEAHRESSRGRIWKSG